MNDIITTNLNDNYDDNNNNNNNNNNNSYDIEWITCYDNNTNSPYYYNTKTGISQWESPNYNIDQNNNNNHLNHFLSPPGGLRPITSVDSPPILKLKLNSKLKLSFRGQNKIIPIITDNENNNNNVIIANGIETENEQNSKELNYQPRVEQKKQRPTVKLKGESLQSLKKALSSNNQFVNINQELEYNNKDKEKDKDKYFPQTYSSNPTEIDHQHYSTNEQLHPGYEYIPSSDGEFNLSQNHSTTTKQIYNHHQQHLNNNNNQQQQQTLNRDYIAMAQTYQEYLPYSHKYFNPNMKCLLCHMFVPIDILFPCGHRCICRTCLSLPTFELYMNLNSSNYQENKVLSDIDPLANPSTKQKKLPCPLCKLIIKKIIPVDKNGLEENKYWDYVLNVGVDKKLNSGLSNEFFSSFNENIELVKSQMHSSNQYQYQNKSKFLDQIDNSNEFKNDTSNHENENIEDRIRNENKNDNESDNNEENEKYDFSESEEKSKQFESFPQFLDDKKYGCCMIQ